MEQTETVPSAPPLDTAPPSYASLQNSQPISSQPITVTLLPTADGSYRIVDILPPRQTVPVSLETQTKYFDETPSSYCNPSSRFPWQIDASSPSFQHQADKFHSLRKWLIVGVWILGIADIVCHLVAGALNSPSTTQAWGKPLGTLMNQAAEWVSVGFGTVYLSLVIFHIIRVFKYHPRLPIKSVPYTRRNIPWWLYLFCILTILSILIPFILQIVWTAQWVDATNNPRNPTVRGDVPRGPGDPGFMAAAGGGGGGGGQQAINDQRNVVNLQQQLYLLHMTALAYVPLSLFFISTATQISVDALRKQLDYPVEPMCCLCCARWNFCKSWQDDDWRERGYSEADAQRDQRRGIGFLIGGLNRPMGS